MWNPTEKLIAALLMASALTGACAAASRPAAAVTPTPRVASPSPSPTPSTATDAVDLTFSGGLSAHVTQVQPAQGGSSNGCGGGTIDLNVILNGQVWSVGASASAYHGPGKYSAGDEFEVLLQSPSFDIWFSTAGTATYSDDKTVAIDIDLVNGMAGPGEPGSTAHVLGTLSCA